MYGVTFFHAYPFLRSRNEQNNSTHCFAYEPDQIKEFYIFKNYYFGFGIYFLFNKLIG